MAWWTFHEKVVAVWCIVLLLVMYYQLYLAAISTNSIKGLV